MPESGICRDGRICRRPIREVTGGSPFALDTDTKSSEIGATRVNNRHVFQTARGRFAPLTREVCGGSSPPHTPLGHIRRHDSIGCRLDLSQVRIVIKVGTVDTPSSGRRTGRRLPQWEPPDRRCWVSLWPRYVAALIQRPGDPRPPWEPVNDRGIQGEMTGVAVLK